MTYQRLTGRKRALVGYSQLWLAPDHLLLVRSTRFTEKYQRFSLADIQAIVITGLPTKMPFQVISFAALIIGIAAYLTSTLFFAKVIIGLGTILTAAAIVVNFSLGPRCRCHLQTAVSREVLPPVDRLRSARRFLARIRPAIEAVQGTLTPELAAGFGAATPAAEKPPEIVDSPGYLPEVLFSLFLVDAAIIAASVRFPKTQLASILFTTLFGELVLLIVALLRRAGRDPRRAVYAIMVPAIFMIVWDGYHIGGTFVGWLNGIAESARRGDAVPPSFENWNPFTQSSAMFAATWRIVAGVAGLAAAWTERRR